jgi:hypothetical protein
MNVLKTAAAILALCFATAAWAGGGGLTPADNKAMHDYVLSMDKIKAMDAAQMELAHSMAGDPALKKQLKDVGSSAKTIADMENRMSAVPIAMAIYKKHGLTAHDAVVMPFVLLYAGTAVTYPAAAPKIAAQTSQTQIAFFRQHQAELRKIGFLPRSQ